jgi:hypothetical protein
VCSGDDHEWRVHDAHEAIEVVHGCSAGVQPGCLNT